MQVLNLKQGSPEWHAHRRQHFNASDAPAMMGCSPHETRTQLIHRLATGIAAEVDAITQRRFDDGHRFEELARPLAEDIIGEDLEPVVGTEGKYSASFDGLTLAGDTAFEHKSLNSQLKAALMADAGTDALPKAYRVQMEQQLMVSGAERVLFMASKWNGDTLVEELHDWYEPDAKLRAEIIAGWEQLEQDLAAYVPAEAKAAPVVAEAMESLPAVSVRLDGKLAVISNLPDFATALRAFIQRIPAKPETDQDFANAEAACKALKRSEDALTAGEDAALGEMVDFEAMRRQVRDLKELARTTRLATEKLVAARKEQLRGEIVAEGVAAYRAHIDSLNDTLGKPYMPTLAVDFGGAVKGKRTVDSLRGAVNDELARAKIAADEVGRKIQMNLNTLREKAFSYAFLFADAAALCQKEPEFVTLTVQTRIAEHEKAEAARLEREREAIRSEEQAKAQREAEARVAKERAEAASAAAPVVAEPAPVVAPAAPMLQSGQDSFDAWRQSGPPANSPGSPRQSAPELEDDGSRLNLGGINERLAPVKLDAAGLSQLGFEPVATVKASRLYRECDLPRICAALRAHLVWVEEEIGAEVMA